jgi:hypothetical protein
LKCDPLALVVAIQASHGLLLSQQHWLVLSILLPQSNTSSVSTGRSSGAGAAPLNGRKCYCCQGDQLVRDCPVHAPVDATGPAASRSGNQCQKPPLAAWKYIKPMDFTIPCVDANGKTWKFCTTCKCRATQTIGIYQLSHWDSEHVDNFCRPGSTPAAILAPLRDTSEAPPEVPVAAPSSTAPQGKITSVANPNPIPLGPLDVTVCPLLSANDAHAIYQIELTGMWCASVDDPTISVDAMFQAQLYCSIVDSPVAADATITMTGPSPSVFERESVHVLLVATVAEDVICDDSDDDDDVTVVTMFPDPDQVDHNDTDGMHYPSTDDVDDSSYDDTSATDNNVDDVASNRIADMLDPTDPWSILSDAVRYGLETLPPDDFYDAMEVETPVTVFKGTKFYGWIDPPLV